MFLHPLFLAAFASYGAVSAGASASSSAYETACSEPSAREGDLLVAQLSYFIDETLVPAMSGWTLLCRDGIVGDGRVQIAVFYKWRGSSAGGPHSPSNVGAGTYWLLNIQAFSGVNTTTPFADYKTATVAGATPSLVMPSMTVGAPNSYLMLATSQWYGAVTYTAPGGWTETGTTGQERKTYDIAAPSTGATGTLTLSASGQNTFAGAWVVIQPQFTSSDVYASFSGVSVGGGVATAEQAALTSTGGVCLATSLSSAALTSLLGVIGTATAGGTASASASTVRSIAGTASGAGLDAAAPSALVSLLSASLALSGSTATAAFAAVYGRQGSALADAIATAAFTTITTVQATAVTVATSLATAAPSSLQAVSGATVGGSLGAANQSRTQSLPGVAIGGAVEAAAFGGVRGVTGASIGAGTLATGAPATVLALLGTTAAGTLATGAPATLTTASGVAFGTILAAGNPGVIRGLTGQALASAVAVAVGEVVSGAYVPAVAVGVSGSIAFAIPVVVRAGEFDTDNDQTLTLVVETRVEVLREVVQSIESTDGVFILGVEK